VLRLTLRRCPLEHELPGRVLQATDAANDDEPRSFLSQTSQYADQRLGLAMPARIRV
jgi:hypothetical protein